MNEYKIRHPRTYGADRRIQAPCGKELRTMTETVRELTDLELKNKLMAKLVLKIWANIENIIQNSDCDKTISDCEYIIKSIEDISK